MKKIMVSASGPVWDTILHRGTKRASVQMSEQDLPAIAEWAYRAYYGEKNEGKRWFRSDVTVENVLDSFNTPQAPISVRNLVLLWQDSEKIRKGLTAITADDDLDSVATYLSNVNRDPVMPTYTKGDSTLCQMSEEIGNVTPTMVNKIFASGAQKLRTLTGGVSPDEMEDDVTVRLMAQIDKARADTALAFAQSLKNFQGNIGAFLNYQVSLHNLTHSEIEIISRDEVEALCLVSAFPEEQLVEVLLIDIDEEENIFKTFQNAVSKKVCPRRAGRPMGSKNKNPMKRKAQTQGEDENTDESSDEFLVDPNLNLGELVNEVAVYQETD